MKTCPSCQAQVVDEAKFCNKCGHKLETQQSNTFCIECGAKLENDSVFCIQCGKKQPQKNNGAFDMFDFSDIEKEAKNQLKEQVKEEKRLEELAKWQVGKSIMFGSYYENDGCFKPIEWTILAREGEKALLISKYVIDGHIYDQENATWETCFLRKWLNNDFFQIAFSETEKAKITETTLVNTNNPKHGTNGGNPTNDKVFVLSADEAVKYFQSDENRRGEPTEYAIKRAGKSALNGKTPWRLRSPGASQDLTVYIDIYGGVMIDGFYKCSNSGIRPAMWISLKELLN